MEIGPDSNLGVCISSVNHRHGFVVQHSPFAQTCVVMLNICYSRKIHLHFSVQWSPAINTLKFQSALGPLK
jgi:hypothetical protein